MCVIMDKKKDIKYDYGHPRLHAVWDSSLVT